MKLYIMRHGDAVADGPTDAQRKLSEEGHVEVLQVAKWLKKMNLGIDLIVSSPYARAKKTAQIVNDVLNLSIEESSLITPNSDPDKILPYLSSLKVNNLLLVSHMPFVARLTGNFLTGDENAPLMFKTAGIACLKMPEICFGSAMLKWFVNPKIINSI